MASVGTTLNRQDAVISSAGGGRVPCFGRQVVPQLPFLGSMAAVCTATGMPFLGASVPEVQQNKAMEQRITSNHGRAEGAAA